MLRFLLSGICLLSFISSNFAWATPRSPNLSGDVNAVFNADTGEARVVRDATVLAVTGGTTVLNALVAMSAAGTGVAAAAGSAVAFGSGNTVVNNFISTANPTRGTTAGTGATQSRGLFNKMDAGSNGASGSQGSSGAGSTAGGAAPGASSTMASAGATTTNAEAAEAPSRALSSIAAYAEGFVQSLASGAQSTIAAFAEKAASFSAATKDYAATKIFESKRDLVVPEALTSTASSTLSLGPLVASAGNLPPPVSTSTSSGDLPFAPTNPQIFNQVAQTFPEPRPPGTTPPSTTPTTPPSTPVVAAATATPPAAGGSGSTGAPSGGGGATTSPVTTTDAGGGAVPSITQYNNTCADVCASIQELGAASFPESSDRADRSTTFKIKANNNTIANGLQKILTKLKSCPNTRGKIFKSISDIITEPDGAQFIRVSVHSVDHAKSCHKTFVNDLVNTPEIQGPPAPEHSDAKGVDNF